MTRSRRLPRKQVAVVLRDAHNYFIAFVKHQITKAVCGKIQALRCISRKNNFIRSCRVNEFPHLFPCLLVFFCRRLRKVIQPAQRICIAFFVKLRHRPDHLKWFLGGCRIVQINKVRMIFENRKILADPVYVKVRAHRVVLSFCAALCQSFSAYFSSSCTSPRYARIFSRIPASGIFPAIASIRARAIIS